MLNRVGHDPPEVTTRRGMAFHESGHALLAYHYGFGIGSITCHPYDETTPYILSLRTMHNAQLLYDDPALAHTAKARRLLAGELAARIGVGMPTSEIVESVDPNHDFSKVIDEATHLNFLDDASAFSWLSQQHAATQQLLLENRTALEELANAVRKFAFPPHTPLEKASYLARNIFCQVPIVGKHLWRRHANGGVNGNSLFDYLQSLNVPIASEAYQPYII